MKAIAKSSGKMPESDVKIAKKAGKKTKSSETPMSDRERLQRVTHVLLSKLEIAIRRRAPVKAKTADPKNPVKKSRKKSAAENPAETAPDSGVITNQAASAVDDKSAKEAEKYNELFGGESCLGALGNITNLLLKLEQPAGANMPANANPYHAPELSMTAADMALLDNFVARMRGSN